MHVHASLFLGGQALAPPRFHSAGPARDHRFTMTCDAARIDTDLGSPSGAGRSGRFACGRYRRNTTITRTGRAILACRAQAAVCFYTEQPIVLVTKHHGTILGDEAVPEVRWKGTRNHEGSLRVLPHSEKRGSTFVTKCPLRRGVNVINFASIPVVPFCDPVRLTNLFHDGISLLAGPKLRHVHPHRLRACVAKWASGWGHRACGQQAR